MKKYLIVNADDFGLSPGVTRGIIEAHQAGVVSSTSLMANMPGVLDAVQRAKHLPNLGVGLHFNLTYGGPLSDPARVPSLVDAEGKFHKNHEVWTEEDVTTELHAQWKRVIHSGIIPTHLDSHHHIQRHPVVYLPMVRLARQAKLPMRKTYPKSFKAKHPTTTDRFISDVYFEGDGTERFIRHLESLRPGVTEMNCHPGYVDDTLKEISSWTDVRETELRALTRSEIIVALKVFDIRLIDYGDLVKLQTHKGTSWHGEY
jgi:chitin disaccharide deacetylase